MLGNVLVALSILQLVVVSLRLAASAEPQCDTFREQPARMTTFMWAVQRAHANSPTGCETFNEQVLRAARASNLIGHHSIERAADQLRQVGALLDRVAPCWFHEVKDLELSAEFRATRQRLSACSEFATKHNEPADLAPLTCERSFSEAPSRMSQFKFLWTISVAKLELEQRPESCWRYNELVLEAAREAHLVKDPEAPVGEQLKQVARLASDMAHYLYEQVWSTPISRNFQAVLGYMNECLEAGLAEGPTAAAAAAAAGVCQAFKSEPTKMGELMRSISEAHYRSRKLNSDAEMCSQFNREVLEAARRAQVIQGAAAETTHRQLEQVRALVEARCEEKSSKFGWLVGWARDMASQVLLEHMSKCAEWAAARANRSGAQEARSGSFGPAMRQVVELLAALIEQLETKLTSGTRRAHSSHLRAPERVGTNKPANEDMEAQVSSLLLMANRLQSLINQVSASQSAKSPPRPLE